MFGELKLVVHVPELKALTRIGAQIVEALQSLRDAVNTLGLQQADQTEALGEQLAAIATELEQIAAGAIPPEEVATLAEQVQVAATLAKEQATQIRANTEQIRAMVPDVPAAPEEPR